MSVKFQSFSKIVGFPHLLTHQNGLAVRRFSIRSSRTSTNYGAEARASKSLIDDEAELSDWIRRLKSKSYRLYSDSDDDTKDRSSDKNVRSIDDLGGKRRESRSADYGVSQSHRQRKVGTRMVRFRGIQEEKVQQWGVEETKVSVDLKEVDEE